MAMNNEPRVYFLRSKTVCRGQELKYFCVPRKHPLCAKLPLIPKKRAAVGYAPPPIRLSDPVAAERQNQRIAERGIELLNLGASQYQLVRPLPSSGKFKSKALIYHANFEARRVDDPQAPNELFFLELVLGPGGMVKPISAYIVQSLGPSDSMTDNEDDDDWRCSMCKKERATHEKDTQPKGMGKKIRHPKNVKFNYDLYATEKVKV
ncbi:uncharacterized protein LOC141616826 [Silene latifolia]|uniref:uncharacterized protein LOC141616826 n=1 Tax=Silene latifolia TaxID=37657 RepID=UPI003D78183E